MRSVPDAILADLMPWSDKLPDELLENVNKVRLCRPLWTVLNFGMIKLFEGC